MITVASTTLELARALLVNRTESILLSSTGPNLPATSSKHEQKVLLGWGALRRWSKIARIQRILPRQLTTSPFSFFFEDVPRDEVDMEREEQTAEPAECTGSGENEDDNIPGSEMVLDEPSTDLPMADASVLAEQGMVSSTEINKSNQSELKDSDEMGFCNTATEPTTNNTKGPTAHNTEGSITNKTKDSIANNTKDPIVHNTTDPTKEKELDFFSLVNHKVKPIASVEEAREHSASAKDNESSVEAPEERSITPDHNTDLAEDFDETPTGTDYEMDPVEELDETSDFEMTSVESLNTKKFDLKPFNYQGCPDNVRKQLLRCLLVSNRKINPYYNFGSIEVPAHKSCRENYTTMIVAFAGNKELLDEATTILYGENVFELQRAKVSLWWLQRIGPNISKLKHLKITVEEGVLDQFLTRLETLWSSIFYLLERKHKLQNLAVSFARWTLRVNNTDGLDPDKHSFVWEPRYEVLRSLLSFRGLDRVVITPGPFVTEHFAEVLEEALLLGPGQTNEEVVRLAEDLAPPKRTKYSFAYVKGST